MNKRVQHKQQASSPLKSPLGMNAPPIKGRERQASILRSLILKEATMFDVDNDLNDERPIGSVKQGNTTFGEPLPTFNKGGLQHPTNQPPQIIKSTQIDPNEI
jgi:hypothetical protein